MSKKMISLTGLTTAILCSWGSVAAQSPNITSPSTAVAVSSSTTPEEPTKGERKAMREFKMLDFNGDGKLSRTEVKLFPRLSAAFDEADTDGDGYVSYEEVKVFAAKYRAERDRQRAAQAAAAPVPSAEGRSEHPASGQ